MNKIILSKFARFFGSRLINITLSLPIFRVRISVWHIFKTIDDARKFADVMQTQFCVAYLDLHYNHGVGYSVMRFSNSDQYTILNTRWRFKILFYHIFSLNRIWFSKNKICCGLIRQRDHIVNPENISSSFPEILMINTNRYGRKVSKDHQFKWTGDALRNVAVLCPGKSLSEITNNLKIYDGFILVNTCVFDKIANMLEGKIFICVIDPVFFVDNFVADKYFRRVSQLMFDKNITLVTYIEFKKQIERRIHGSHLNKVKYIYQVPRDGFRPIWGCGKLRVFVDSYGNVLTDCAIPVAASVAKKICFYGCDGIPKGENPSNNSYPKSAELKKIDDEIYQGLLRLGEENFQGISDRGYKDNVEFGISQALRVFKKTNVHAKIIVKSHHEGFKSLEIGM